MKALEDSLAEARAALFVGTVCVCDEDGCSGEAHENDPGFCVVCAEMDSEVHCPKCPYECCEFADG